MDASSTTFTSKLGYGKHEWTQNRLTEIIQLYNVLYTLHKDGRLWDRLGWPVSSHSRKLKIPITNVHAGATSSTRQQLVATQRRGAWVTVSLCQNPACPGMHICMRTHLICTT